MKINDATLPFEISTNLAAASAVPPVAIKSSIIRIFRFYLSDLYEPLSLRSHTLIQNQLNIYLQVTYFFSEHYKRFFNI